MPFTTAVDNICNIYTVKRMPTTLDRVNGAVVVYRVGALAITGSERVLKLKEGNVCKLFYNLYFVK